MIIGEPWGTRDKEVWNVKSGFRLLREGQRWHQNTLFDNLPLVKPNAAIPHGQIKMAAGKSPRKLIGTSRQEETPREGTQFGPVYLILVKHSQQSQRAVGFMPHPTCETA